MLAVLDVPVVGNGRIEWLHAVNLVRAVGDISAIGHDGYLVGDPFEAIPDMRRNRNQIVMFRTNVYFHQVAARRTPGPGINQNKFDFP